MFDVFVCGVAVVGCVLSGVFGGVWCVVVVGGGVVVVGGGGVGVVLLSV